MSTEITVPFLASLLTTYRLSFKNGLDSVDPVYKAIATIVTSGGQSNTYGWLNDWPGMQLWMGDRVIKQLKTKGYQIWNEDYETTVSVPRKELEDDLLGIYATKMEAMGQAVASLPDELIFLLLNGAHETLCFDDQNYFDTDHPVNSEADGNGQDVSVSNMTTDPAYSGQPWYLMCTSKTLKPMIWQVRKKAQFVAMTKREDENVFMRGEYRYGVDGRWAAGFGFWQMAHRIAAEPTLETLWAAYTAMGKIVSDGGRKINVTPDLIVCGKSNEKSLTRLMNREFVLESSAAGAAAVSNEMRGKFKLLSTPYIL